MAKIQKAFFCQVCGYETPKWIGRCPSCNEWNSFVEEVICREKGGNMQSFSADKKVQPQLINRIDIVNERRTTTGFTEIDRILGGGIVEGSLILVGGEPGIGKSTLALQLAIQNSDIKTLYVSGEESVNQVKLRAQRLEGKGEQCYIVSETLLENVLSYAEQLKPNLIVVDSIQTIASNRIESSPGSISQIKDCAALLLKFAKETGISILIISHITKDGSIAGPKVLEHVVDAVLQFEGENQHIYRILRASKNRFGSASEMGLFEMTDSGLQVVADPSQILTSHRSEQLSGITVAASVNGMRPMLIETQALVSTAVYGMPQRSTTGFDARRLNMLLAVLEKRAGFHLASKDVFLNIAGGVRVTDPATDLSVAAAVLSSTLDIPVPSDCCFAAEVGLSGEVRPIARIEQRIAEAERRGFGRIFISQYNSKGLKLDGSSIKVLCAARIEEVFQKIFKQ